MNVDDDSENDSDYVVEDDPVAKKQEAEDNNSSSKKGSKKSKGGLYSQISAIGSKRKISALWEELKTEESLYVKTLMDKALKRSGPVTDSNTTRIKKKGKRKGKDFARKHNEAILVSIFGRSEATKIAPQIDNIELAATAAAGEEEEEEEEDSSEAVRQAAKESVKKIKKKVTVLETRKFAGEEITYVRFNTTPHTLVTHHISNHVFIILPLSQD